MANITGPRQALAWILGIDGAGNGTRVRLQAADGRTLGHGQAGPSGLSQGVDQAWRHVERPAGRAERTQPPRRSDVDGFVTDMRREP